MNGRRTTAHGEKSTGRGRAAVVAPPPTQEESREHLLQEIRRDLERQRQTLLDEAGVGFIQEAKTLP